MYIKEVYMRKTINSNTKDILSKEELSKLHPLMRTASNNKYITLSLFLETAKDTLRDNVINLEQAVEEQSIRPIFTLKEENVEKEGVIYYSLKKIYFSYDHIPGFEYEFAKDVFNSWEHWCRLCEGGSILTQNINKWREEYTIMIQSKAFKALAKTAYYDGAKGTPAARFLADRGWEVKRGRPSKEEVERVKKIEAGVEKEVAEDIERLGLTLIKTK